MRTCKHSWQNCTNCIELSSSKPIQRSVAANCSCLACSWNKCTQNRARNARNARQVTPNNFNIPRHSSTTFLNIPSAVILFCFAHFDVRSCSSMCRYVQIIASHIMSHQLLHQSQSLVLQFDPSFIFGCNVPFGIPFFSLLKIGPDWLVLIILICLRLHWVFTWYLRNLRFKINLRDISDIFTSLPWPLYHTWPSVLGLFILQLTHQNESRLTESKYRKKWKKKTRC